MKTFLSISEFKSHKKTILTIGTYDGVHLGHQKILEKIVNQGAEKNLETVIITFFPHPRMVLQQNTDIKLLHTLDEKSKLLEQNNIQNLIVHPFDQQFSNLTAEEFVSDYLVKQLNVAKIIIGYDHKFGKNRTAGISDLIQFGEKYGFEVEQISVEEVNEISVSSTKIRNALLNGEIVKANSYLGYSYFFSGKVIKGDQLGRTIGFPTANLKLEEEYKLIPKNGVYIVLIQLKQINLKGIMNIGVRPTVSGSERRIEVYIFDFDELIYDQNLTITVLDKIREEEKFESLDKLKIQLKKDQQSAMNYFSEFLQ